MFGNFESVKKSIKTHKGIIIQVFLFVAHVYYYYTTVHAVSNKYEVMKTYQSTYII